MQCLTLLKCRVVWVNHELAKFVSAVVEVDYDYPRLSRGINLILKYQNK